MHFLSSYLALVALAVPTTLAHHAIAVLKPTTNSTISGFLVIEQNGNTSMLNITLSGLQPNQKVGFHIHNFGDIHFPDGTAAGGHYNPTNVAHGCTPALVLNATYATTPAILPTNFHVGDIGNVQADANGNVNTCATSTLISLNAKDAGFAIGRGVIVHAQPDDCATQPTGNAGARLAQAAIGWKINGTTPSPETFTGTDTTPKSAIAVLTPSSGSNVAGMIVFTQNSPSEAVSIQVVFSGVSPSTRHGLHLHAFGDISDAAGLKTAGHYNPLNVTHGCFANATRHAGDLDNIDSDASGKISVILSSNLISLYNGAPTFVVGRGAILHSQPDDCATQPTGNAGSRLAQGVIGFRNISLPLPINNNTTTTTASVASTSMPAGASSTSAAPVTGTGVSSSAPVASTSIIAGASSTSAAPVTGTGVSSSAPVTGTAISSSAPVNPTSTGTAPVTDSASILPTGVASSDVTYPTTLPPSGVTSGPVTSPTTSIIFSGTPSVVISTLPVLQVLISLAMVFGSMMAF